MARTKVQPVSIGQLVRVVPVAAARPDGFAYGAALPLFNLIGRDLRTR